MTAPTHPTLSDSRQRLLDAFKRHCFCDYREDGSLREPCAGHVALTDPMIVLKLEFVARIADTLVLEEWGVDLKDAMRPREEPLPYLVSEFSWSLLKGMDL